MLALRSPEAGTFEDRQGRWVAKRRELEAHYLASGGPAVLDFLHAQLSVKEAAAFLCTSEGQLYHLIWRYEVPFILWGEVGKRFCRLDLLVWRDMDANERANMKLWLMQKYPRKQRGQSHQAGS